MQRFSRAQDSIWLTAAFDPRKPVDEGWASKPPAPVLRSGDERDVFSDNPWEHHQGGDAMSWNPEGHGSEEPDFDGEEEYDNEPMTLARPDIPDHDLRAIGVHRKRLRGDFGATPSGRLDGSDPGTMAQYYNDSSVAHYYNFNPHSDDGGKPWVLNTHHWELREPMTSRHVSFEVAARQAAGDKFQLKRLGIR